ncbi:MAG: neutral zinc metallopeptidase [Alphaproteobacteria bacterium]|nr:neutral zinc metallopeptidase [Alphaproteobacteria bacterium]
MKTDGRRQSGNIEDRRGQSAGGGGRFPIGRASTGGGLGLIVIVVVSYFLGIDPSQIIDTGSVQSPAGSSSSVPYQETAQEAERSKLVKVVLAETEDTWTKIFATNGKTYEKPVLVLFNGAVDTHCGFAQSAAGPFYCPADRKLFLDLTFFDDMRTKLGAGGDFAMAYVIAHEVGHHIQTVLGISTQVNQQRARSNETQGNALSVKVELQADCLAGVWASHTDKKLLDAGDIEEAMTAAAAVGDDRLQKSAQGYVVPESFTHGSSADRVAWFKKGLQTGEVGQCDTFAGGNR